MNADLIAALALDALLGEPPRRWHPVCWMGSAVAAAEAAALDCRDEPRRQKLKGAAIAVSLPLATWWLSRRLLGCLPRPLSLAAGTLVTAVALARRSLSKGARDVADGLALDTEEGRRRVASLVGRDTDGMDEADIVRAAVESVAENANDGVVAPLFYAWAGGAPLALAYKMVNTLDSMIGYRSDRYREFGWAAARLDDMAGYIPARLTAAAAVAAAPLVGGSPLKSAIIWWRDASGHSSPNAGVCEAAFAGALGVRLGGRNFYQGQVVEGHVMGRESGSPRIKDIRRAVLLMESIAVLVTVLGLSRSCPSLGRWGKRRGGSRMEGSHAGVGGK
jgi:adenosylcobinamide-phosphate synthase